MRLAQYLQRTYLFFFLGISGGLTVLCNLVELLERLVHSAAVSFSTLLIFVGLNMVPTWLTLLPLTMWLAMLATLYHLSARHEWHVCEVLGIHPLRIVTPFLTVLCALILSISIAKHSALDALAWRAHTYHATHFAKQKTAIVSGTVGFTPALLCRAESFDQATQQGSNLTIYHYTQAVLTAIETAPHFSLQRNTSDNLVISIPSSHFTDPHTGIVSSRGAHSFTHEPFIIALHATQPYASLTTLLSRWWHTPSHLKHVRVAHAHDIQNDIKPLTEGLLFALLTLILFLLFHVPFLLLLCSYPALLTLTLLCSWIGKTPPLTGTILLLISLCLIFVIAKAQNSRILRSS